MMAAAAILVVAAAAILAVFLLREPKLILSNDETGKIYARLPLRNGDSFSAVCTTASAQAWRRFWSPVGRWKTETTAR